VSLLFNFILREKMNIEKLLIKPLYQNSFDGDSYHTYIKFENMQIILSEQEKAVKQYMINFYEYMDDNYKRVADGFVTKMSFDKSNPIITIEKALEEYENNRT